jgi:hypothetical protein
MRQPEVPRLDLYGRQPRRMGCNLWFVQNKAQALLDVSFYKVCED